MAELAVIGGITALFFAGLLVVWTIETWQRIREIREYDRQRREH